MDDLADEIHSLVDSVETQIQTALSASTLSLFSALPTILEHLLRSLVQLVCRIYGRHP